MTLVDPPAREARVPTTDQVTCPTCFVPYRAALTAWACPVCDTPAPGAEGRRARVIDSPDDRLLALVLVATIANVLLFAGLTLLVLRA